MQKALRKKKQNTVARKRVGFVSAKWTILLLCRRQEAKTAVDGVRR